MLRKKMRPPVLPGQPNWNSTVDFTMHSFIQQVLRSESCVGNYAPNLTCFDPFLRLAGRLQTSSI
jgi:hypothetical protein